ASTAGKTVSYFKGKSKVIDLGHKPSQAAIAGAASKLRAAKVATTPKATPKAASTAPEIKIPHAAKATTPNPAAEASKSNIGFVVGGGAAAVAGAVALAMKKRAPNHAGKGELKIPTVKGGLAVQKGELAIKTPTKVKPVVTKHATLKSRHDARRAKQGTALRHAFEGAERADARAAVPKVTVPKVTVPKVTVPKVTATGTGFYDEAGLKKVDERRAADRRKGAETRRASTRAKAGAVDVRTTPGRTPTKQKSNRRKPGSDPRGEAAKKKAAAPADADMIKAEVKASQAKPLTKASIQTEIDITKGQVTRLKGVQGTEMGANRPLVPSTGLTQVQRDIRIADLEIK
ncbi:hypothetical protein LCGC14_3102180, partial [marine sediment metagenome]